jgi:phage terminase large subunit GpA-like protein
LKNLDNVGAGWIVEQVEELTDTIERVTPVQFNEENRYLPSSVTSMPGYIRYSVNPYMREIVNCFDINSPVREVNLKKGVQITYTTVLESGLLYAIGVVKSLPCMLLTADKELASARVENNIIPMLNESDMGDLVRSSDEGNTRKTGKTANHIQWAGGGYLVPFGAQNAAKMRSFSICFMFKDELDAYPDIIGKDGDPDKLSDKRCSAYWESRKIFRGSTPLIKGVSKIDKAYENGDKRKYHVLCQSKTCRHPQPLLWEDKKGPGGFKWDLDEEGLLDTESVRWCCIKCGHAHYEHDKVKLFSEEDGAKWIPTAKPKMPNVRSYHLPALYSPAGFFPWYQCVADWLAAWDVENRRVKDIGLFQEFYNNILGLSFEITGAKLTFSMVSSHRRQAYKYGQVPNKFAEEVAGSKIMFLTCEVDVHKEFLAVTVHGWAKHSKCFAIDYLRLEGKDCSETTDPVWGQLRELIEEKRYVADDGTTYNVLQTLVDAGYANDTVVSFCSAYITGVYPIVGRDRPAKHQKISEFAEFKTQAGTLGYRILVDHYKDRLATVLRREWLPESGLQGAYHFNAPVDATDAQLKELTVEYRRKRMDPTTNVESYFWYRPGNARNEWWDLLGYGHCSVEITAWKLCIQEFELETIDWEMFWQFADENPDRFGRA